MGVFVVGDVHLGVPGGHGVRPKLAFFAIHLGVESSQQRV